MTPSPDPLPTVLAALELAGKATPGPWEVHHAKTREFITTISSDDVGDGLAFTSCGDADQQNDDADAIVALRNSVPAIKSLCDEVERLRAEIDELKATHPRFASDRFPSAQWEAQTESPQLG